MPLKWSKIGQKIGFFGSEYVWSRKKLVFKGVLTLCKRQPVGIRVSASILPYFLERNGRGQRRFRKRAGFHLQLGRSAAQSERILRGRFGIVEQRQRGRRTECISRRRERSISTAHRRFRDVQHRLCGRFTDQIPRAAAPQRGILGVGFEGPGAGGEGEGMHLVQFAINLKNFYAPKVKKS